MGRSPLTLKGGTMFEIYFRYFLKSKGFEEVDKVFWSLSWSQGDGCSFTTSLNADDIQRLVSVLYTPNTLTAPEKIKNLLLSREASQLIQNSDESLGIQITQESNQYVHKETMSYDWEGYLAVDCNGMTTDEFENKGYKFTENIFKYAKSLAGELENIGYSLLEAFNHENKEVWRFKTENYLVKLTELSDDTGYYDDAMSDWDEECLIDTCESIISGKTVIRSISVEVFYLTDNPDYDEPIGESSIHTIACCPKDRSYGGYRREMVSCAISETRNYLRDQDKKLNKEAA